MKLCLIRWRFIFQEPYSLIRMILSKPLGFMKNTTTSERQNKLTEHLSKYKHSEHFCALNQIFNVDFYVSQQYSEVEIPEKRKILQNILVTLMYSCFRILWVIIVDDAEFIDVNSQSMLNVLARQDLVLFVMSFGQKRPVNYELLSIIPKRSQVR